MPADIAALLSEAPWLTRLARSLTGDGADADDVVQETYAAALRSPPETDRPLRPWLRRVALNVIRMRHRGRTRQSANEMVAETQVEPVRTPEQLLERAQLERRLAELVIELDEPFRSTVLLRYREGLSAEMIAKQHGIPAGTVRSRLKTALDRMRRDLDEREKTRMRALLVPLVAARRPEQTLWRALMAKLTSKLAVVVVLIVLLLGGVLLWQRVSRPAATTAQRSSEPRDGAGPATRAGAPDPAAFAQPGVVARPIRGRVTRDGQPYVGASVHLVHAETQVVLGETTSRADGSFDLGPRAADVYVVTASAPDRTAGPVRVDLRAPAAPALELRLTTCSRLRGVVVDGSGAPIDHARIARADAPLPFAESDASGRYELCTRFGATDVLYSASGYHSLIVALDVRAATTRDVVLIPEATVAGTVVTTAGVPVPGAWIVIDPSDKGGVRNAPARGLSAADGSFRITRVAPGRNLISAFAPGLLSPHKIEIVVGAGQVTESIVLHVAPAARIAGVVVAAGAPVVGAGVGMRVGEHDERGVLAVTQADGSFVIDRAPRGDVALYVDNYTVLAPRSVRVTEDRNDVRIEVDVQGTVRGRVLHAGRPVADAQVTCPRGEVFADAEGAFTCEGVDAGAHELFADTPSGRWGSGTVTVARGETAHLDLELSFAAAICGTVVDERGTAVEGLEVRVTERDTGDAGRDTTARDGRFCARFLTGGTYEVGVFAGARRVETVAPLAPVVVRDAEARAEVRLAIVSPAQSIAGTIADSHGAPVADAIVRIVAANKVGTPVFDSRLPRSLTLTDTAGHFELRRLSAGDYTIIASARDGSEAIASPIAAGARDVTITLDAAGRIEGRLVGFASEPVITGLLMTGTHNAIDAEVAGDRFHASGLSPGTYVFTAVTNGHEGDTQEVVVHAGKTATVTMTSRGTATIEGTARDYRTRAPIPRLRCYAGTRRGDAIGQVYFGPDSGIIADERGAFRLSAPAGEILVTCGGGGNTSGMRLAVAPRDRTTNIDVLTVTRTQQPGTIDAGFAFPRNRIAELTKGGPADRAGLAIDDEVIAVDGVSVVDVGSRGTMLAITQRPAGTRATLTIQRGGDQRTIAVTVRAAD